MNSDNEEKKNSNMPFYFFVGVFSVGAIIGLVYLIYAMFFS
jgi:hypothetical protein